jgi:alginate O-acetyltransferase complex protein AlgI
MTITSIQFPFFIILALGIYYLLPQRPQNYWLLLVSYMFIVSWDWRFALILGIVTGTNFVMGQKLIFNGLGQRGWLWLGIGFNLFILICFRVANYFLPELEILMTRFGIPFQTGGIQILIPIGLSYYILQNISYLVDVYRGRLKAEPDWLIFSLYLAYFPKLIAGPIERARSFLPKLARSRIVDGPMIARSLLLIFVGMVRKLVIADILNVMILPDVYNFPAKYTPPELISWLIIYAFVLYNDFAGYTEIVRGVSGLFGIELSPNFRAPYFSRNFSEFWKRWHITLSEWLRDYIYFPLSRALIRSNYARRNLATLILPPLITMFISGLWHGFGLNMLLWGGLHGIYLIFERLSTLRRSVTPPETQPKWRQGLAMAVVFTFIILAWVPFRWEFPVAMEFWSALFDWSTFAIRYRRLIFVVPFIILSLMIDFLQYHSQDEYIFLKWPRLAQAACLAIVLLSIFITTGGDFEQPFVYQGF